MDLTIGQFNESFPPIIDGVANVVKNYAYWLNKKHGSCCVITPKHPKADDSYDFPVYRFASFKVPTRNEYRFGFPQMSTSFWMSLKKIPFDIVHAHCPFSTGIAARSIAKRQGIPLIATFHSKFREDFMDAFKSEIIVESILAKIAAFFDTADEVWTVNEASIETLREYGYKGPVYVMGNGCDLAPCRPGEKDLGDIDAMCGIQNDMPLLVYIGQLVWQKNLKMLLEALALLKKRGTTFHMLFVGEGAKHPDMEMIVRESGLEANVTFAGRIADRDMITKIYLRSTAMLFPSLYDTSSLVPREAAACCCPTVFVSGSSTSYGITDQDGFFTENNAQSMADTVAQIIADPAHARQVGENAQRVLYRSWEDAVDLAFERYLYVIDTYQRGHRSKANGGKHIGM